MSDVRPKDAVCIPADEVRVGDDFLFVGRPHRITSLVDYDTTRLLGQITPGAKLAYSYDGWCISLFPGQPVWVVRP